ncbi:uncharacterized protein DUF3180 [Branchiibius hedensis]|uniref:DUF3180 domain-containing protein n=1 Tax=Branchiibius hedensis TaxID=672460 RepID=A0A2Y8ZS99_9MICO|nr:DUF3180 domain-containing protein [Branchiibius hedensis]PWJ23979.1 uncharacterized protein DUF3180 [Branchiibius hedensis]SSA32797.1 Protein of unknown function [Branchiibius hedensis]
MIDLSEGVRIRYALIGAGVVLVLSFFGLRWWTSRGNSMPTNSWITVVVLLMIAAAVLVAGWEIRRYLRSSKKVAPPSPQRARATLVAAQACALAGSVFAGWYLAQVLVHIDRVSHGADRAPLILALVSGASATAVAVSGFVVQAWCRLPPEDEDSSGSANGYPAIPA